MPIRREIGLACLCALLALFGASCGSTQSTPQPVSVSVSPSSASVQAGATQQFTATASTNSAVTWQINGVAGGNATVGTISSSGLYTAPASVPSPATVTVAAVSQADNTKSGSAAVTVTAPPAITLKISPSTTSVGVGTTQGFTATISGTLNAGITWSVNGVQGGNATVGTVSSSGVYTAPSSVPNPPTVTVQAVSVADTTKSDSATVTITQQQITVSLVPAGAWLHENGTQQFTAIVTGTSDTAITWSLNDGIGGTGPTLGTISASGLYTAPASAPDPLSVWVIATPHADPSKFAIAVLGVTPAANSRFAYVSSYPDNKIAAFSVDNTTGLLTPTTTASVPAGTTPGFLAMHPSGKFLYVLGGTSNNVSIFSINRTTGDLTAAGSTAALPSPFYMVFSPDGLHAYVTCDGSHAVIAYSVDNSTGALTQLSGSPYTINGGRVRGIAITPDNKYLYVADRDAIPAAIHGFTIDQNTGALVEMQSPFPGDFIGTLTVDKPGHFLYAGSPDDVNLSGYSIDSTTGALTFMADYPAGTSSTSTWLFDPSGTHLYGGSTSDNNVFGFKQNSDGSMTSIGGMPVSAATFPNGGGIHPNGRFAYVVSTISDQSIQPGVITIYTIDSTSGAFTQISSTPAGLNNTIGFAITP